MFYSYSLLLFLCFSVSLLRSKFSFVSLVGFFFLSLSLDSHFKLRMRKLLSFYLIVWHCELAFQTWKSFAWNDRVFNKSLWICFQWLEFFINYHQTHTHTSTPPRYYSFPIYMFTVHKQFIKCSWIVFMVLCMTPNTILYNVINSYSIYAFNENNLWLQCRSIYIYIYKHFAAHLSSSLLLLLLLLTLWLFWLQFIMGVLCVCCCDASHRSDNFQLVTCPFKDATL